MSLKKTHTHKYSYKSNSKQNQKHLKPCDTLSLAHTHTHYREILNTHTLHTLYYAESELQDKFLTKITFGLNII